MGYMPGGFGCAAAGPGVVDEKTGRRVGVRLEYVDPRDGARPGQLGRYITKLQAGFELTHQLDASRAAVQGLCAVMLTRATPMAPQRNEACVQCVWRRWAPRQLRRVVRRVGGCRC